MTSVSTCPHTIAQPLMGQRWADVSFAHWRVDPGRVRAILPPGLEPDTFAGSAWVSLVGFEMRDLTLRHLPPVPTTSRFLEFNVRTYVQGPNGPGVWFASLDVDAHLPVVTARAGFSLPYCLADVSCDRRGDQVRWEVARRWPGAGRATLDFEVGAPLGTPDELDVWLTARWALYAATRSGRLVWAPVEHEPWPLQRATCTATHTELARTAGLAVDGAPARVHHASTVTVRVGRPRILAPVPVPALELYYDDDCGLCQACVTWLAARTGPRVAYTPASSLPADAPLRATLATAIAADDGHRALVGVDAVVAALARSSRPWRWAAEVLCLPGVRPVAGLVYRWVARHRATISQRLGLRACALPPHRTTTAP